MTSDFRVYEAIDADVYSGLIQSAWVKPADTDVYWVVMHWGEIESPFQVRIQIKQDGVPVTFAERTVTPRDNDTVWGYGFNPLKGTPYRLEVECQNAIFTAHFPCIQSNNPLIGWHIVSFTPIGNEWIPLP